MRRILPLCSALLLAALATSAGDFGELRKRVSEFTLSNGLRFVVLERHDSPLVSFHTVVNVGSINDPAGEAGMSNLVQRMAFKGTETIGTRGWPEEKKALYNYQRRSKVFMKTLK